MDTFTRQYIETAIGCSFDDDGNPLDKNYSVNDLAPETLEKMKQDCQKFQEENENDIDMNDEEAGHDFWMTRNHEGAGFWDGDWEDKAGNRLTEASHAFGELHLYVGDDNKLYAM